jgi:predicted phosphodiesterase
LLRTLNPFGRYRRYISPSIETSLSTPQLAIRTLNTSRGAQPRLNWSKGAINLEAVRRAAVELNEAKAALKVLVCHHPLVEPKQVAVSGNVYRGEEAAKILASSGIDMILTGHVHNPFALALPHYGGMTYAIGAGTLSCRTRGTPESFSMIEADDKTINVSALGWSGTAFEPLLSWALPRRAPLTNELLVSSEAAKPT